MAEDVTYALAAKFSLLTVGLQTAVETAMRSLSGLESGATRAENSAGVLQSRLDRAAIVHQRYAGALRDTPAFMQSYQGAAERAADSQARVTQLTQAHTAALSAAAAEQQRLATVTAGTNKIMAGTAITAGGLGMLGFLKEATGLAAQLNSTMQQVQIATGATPAQMAGLQSAAVNQGLRTQFSLNDEAGIIAAMTRAGIYGQGSVGRIQGMLPAVSNFDEIMKMTRGEAAPEATTTAVELAHLFGQYDSLKGKNGPGVNYMLDQAARALAVSPGTPREFQTTLSQMSGQMRPLYGDNRKGFINDTLSLAMLEAQLGQAGRGGTQVASMIGRTLGAGATSFGSRTSNQDKDLRELSRLSGGLSFFNKGTGQFAGMANFLHILELAAKRDHNPQEVGRLFKGAFGAVGIRQAGVLSDPVTVAQFAKAGSYLNGNGSVNIQRQQDLYNATPLGQQAKALKNWQSFETLIGVQLIPALTKVFNLMAGVTGWMVQVANAHPGITKIAAGLAAAMTALALIVGPLAIFVGGLQILGGGAIIAGIVGATGALAAMIPLSAGLVLTLLPIIGTVGAIVLAVGAVILVFQHWSTITGVVGGLLNWMTDKLHALLVAVGVAHDSSGPTVGRSGVTQGDATFYNQAHPYAPQVGKGPGHWQAYRGGATWVPDHPKAPAHHAGKGGGAGVTFHAGAIVVNPHPHQNAAEIADMVWQRISEKSGMDSRRHGSTNVGWDVGYGGI